MSNLRQTSRGVLWLVDAERTRYQLTVVFQGGWRIVSASPEEQALLQARARRACSALTSRRNWSARLLTRGRGRTFIDGSNHPAFLAGARGGGDGTVGAMAGSATQLDRTATRVRCELNRADCQSCLAQRLFRMPPSPFPWMLSYSCAADGRAATAALTPRHNPSASRRTARRPARRRG